MKSTQMEGTPVDPVQKDEGIKKQPFVEPKLTFVQPKLEKHGKVEEITAGFFGSFSP